MWALKGPGRHAGFLRQVDRHTALDHFVLYRCLLKWRSDAGLRLFASRMSRQFQCEASSLAQHPQSMYDEDCESEAID